MFRFNDNFPAFMLMSIIVALFMGLTVSAEEIIRDRKILKRESFLNLSWNSYLQSKIIILFSLSALQTLTFVLIGNLILEIEWAMLLPFWFVLFTTSCFANILGLNISSAFNSAVTVYVMIPLLLIPQMILSGLLFSFDKLNNIISTKGKVPVIADMMASRWAYEALAVYQFKNNSYEAPYYSLEKEEAQADFKTAFLVEELKKRNRYANDHFETKNDSILSIVDKELRILKEEIQHEPFKNGLEQIDLDKALTAKGYSTATYKSIETYLADYKDQYQKVYNQKIALRERMIAYFESNKEMDYNLNDFKNKYYNESLADLVMNISVKDRIIEYNGQLIQQINPVFMDPKTKGSLDYRAQFFAPYKNFLGVQIDTFWFDLIVIWLMSMILYITLYFELLKKGLDKASNLNLNIKLPGKK
jgi:hypothetical protein